MSSAALIDDHLLVGVGGVRLLRRDEGRADIGEVGAHRLRGEDRRGRWRCAPDSASGPSNHSRISWTSAKGEMRAGMAAGAGRDRDQAVGALLDRLAGEAVVDDVVQHDAAIGMRSPAFTSSRAPSEVMTIGTLYFTQSRQIVLEPVVGLVDDLVDGEGRRRPLGMRLVVRGQLLGDPRQPFVELRGRAAR